MRTNRLYAAGSALALSLSLVGGAQAQNTQTGVRVGEYDHIDHIHGQPMAVGKANKASSLIGMDVRNEQNEKLGEIKDMVVDLQSGRIAYVVLSVGGFLGIGDKYVAIPPHAFTLASDQEKLVLNADKSKLQNAPSFAKTSWPELNSPTWNSDVAYWKSDASAQGTVGSSRSGTFSSASDATTLSNRDQFHGRITAVNPETRTISVEGPSGSREFKFSEHPVITLKDNRSPRISDLKVGYPVDIGYHKVNGTDIADTVIRSDAPDVK